REEAAGQGAVEAAGAAGAARPQAGVERRADGQRQVEAGEGEWQPRGRHVQVAGAGPRAAEAAIPEGQGLEVGPHGRRARPRVAREREHRMGRVEGDGARAEVSEVRARARADVELRQPGQAAPAEGAGARSESGRTRLRVERGVALVDLDGVLLHRIDRTLADRPWISPSGNASSRRPMRASPVTAWARRPWRTWRARRGCRARPCTATSRVARSRSSA